jgi:hypothetical protein
MVQVLSVAITGPLERYAAGLVAHLLSLQYTRLSARNQLALFAHLSRWLAGKEARCRRADRKSRVSIPEIATPRWVHGKVQSTRTRRRAAPSPWHWCRPRPA